MSRPDKARDKRQSVVRQMTIINPCGFHARPATIVAKIAFNFDCDITIEKDGTKVSAKSVMGLLSLEAGRGTTIKVMAEGRDAAKAVAKIEEVVTSETVES